MAVDEHAVNTDSRMSCVLCCIAALLDASMAWPLAFRCSEARARRVSSQLIGSGGRPITFGWSATHSPRQPELVAVSSLCSLDASHLLSLPTLQSLSSKSTSVQQFSAPAFVCIFSCLLPPCLRHEGSIPSSGRPATTGCLTSQRGHHPQRSCSSFIIL